MTTSFRGIPNLITVDRRVSEPLYQQIYDSFRMHVTNGALRPGQLVPSTRQLARELRVSRLPVLNAYAQLLAEGYFESRVGAGTFVASLPASAKPRVRVAAYSIPPARRVISKDAARMPPYARPDWAASLGPFQVGQPDLYQFPID